MKTSLYLLALIMFLAASAHAEVTYTLDEDYGNVPVTFVPNVGQFASSIKFAIEGNGQGMFTESSLASGTTFVLDASFVSPGETYSGFFLHFLEANGNPAITGEDRVSWNSSYFIGNDPENWHTDIPNYRSIRLRDLYEGIDLVYTSDARRLVFNLVVHPGHAPTQVGFIHPHELGDATITETGDGGLIVGHKGYPTKTYYPPRCYQVAGGQEVDVEISYRFSGLFVYFEFGEYDEAQDLIIELDRVYSTKFAYKETKEVNDLEIDDDGNAYVAGDAGYIVLDGDHPGPGGPGSFGALFAIKLNEAGNGLKYVTYYKNALTLFSPVIDLDSNRNLYIADDGCFCLKLNNLGSEIIYLKEFGGSGYDRVSSMIVDDIGNAYLYGTTTSSDFPTTEYAYDKSKQYSTKRKTFISKLNSDGSDFVFSTYFGSEDMADNAGGIALDSKYNVYVAGNTNSKNIPLTDDTYTKISELSDVFVAKFNSDGSELIFSTLIGGNKGDYGGLFTLDANGDIILLGRTESEDFPVTDGSYDTSYNGEQHVFFIFKLSGDGKTLQYSSFIGDSSSEYFRGIEMDASGNPIIYVDLLQGLTFFEMETHTNQINRLFAIEEHVSRLKLNNENDLFLIRQDNYDKNQFPVKYHIDSDGTYINEQNEQISLLNISPPYPNPFNSLTTIECQLAEYSNLTVSIYNINGQLVEKLFSDYISAGRHVFQWKADNVASGLYYCKIESNNFSKTSKIILLR